MQKERRYISGTQLTIVVFSGDLDRLLVAFIIATGAAAMYEQVVTFFTFWGISSLRDIGKRIPKGRQRQVDWL